MHVVKERVSVLFKRFDIVHFLYELAPGYRA